MAIGKNIKGITIEFGGDTTKLGKALDNVEKQSRGVESELRSVNNALKFNPTNTELLAQKQQMLGQRVQATKDKLVALRNAQAKLDEDPSVDKTSQDYIQLRREIITTESKLKHFEAEARKLNSVKLTALSKELKNVGGKMTGIGQTMTQSVTAPLVAGFTAGAMLASDYEENLNKLDVAFGESAKSVKAWSDTALENFGLSKVQATEAASAFGALGKGIGLTEKDAASMSTSLAGLSADLGSYFNTGTDESAKALEGIFTGESEALKKFGVVMTDTNLQKFAEDQGLVWKEMDQTEKTMLRYNYVMEKTKDAQGDFARTNDGTANSLKMFKSSVQDLGTTIGAVILPIITPIVQKLAELVQKFGELSPTAQKVITIIGIIVAAVGPLLMVIGSLATGIGSIIGLAGTLGVSFTALTGPVGIIIAAIAGAIAIGVALYKNWDKIKEMAGKLKDFVVAKFTAMKENVKAIFTAVKNAMIAPVEKAKDIIKGIIDKIKGFFSKLKFKWPEIKLPHFGIQPDGWKIGDLLKGVIPKLGIEWYAKGGIFKSPAVIGMGDVRGGEAAVPLDPFWDKMDRIVEAVETGSGDSFVFNIYANEGMNVRQLADEIEKRMVRKQRQKERVFA